jgi:glycine oxidase
MKVVIIGAGVAGLAIGWRMQQAGASVTVLERGQAAMSATWASAGMIAVAGERTHAASAEVDFMRHASHLWPDFASEVEAASGAGVDYRRNGALLVAGPAAADTGLDFLSADEARRKEPMLAPDIPGALWAPDDAQVDNRALGRALAVAFQRAGGILSINEPAVRFVHDGNAVHAVQTPFTHHAADAFVVAAGAWSGSLGGLPPGVLPPVKPVKGEVLAIAPPAGATIPTHVVRGEVYLVPRPDRMLIGATMSDTGFDTRTTREAADWLSSRAMRLMPSLADWGIAERWAGLRPGAPDGLPVLGRTVLDRLFVASGQFRNGILFAPAVAENMSRLVLEQVGAIAEFDPRRFSKR